MSVATVAKWATGRQAGNARAFGLEAVARRDSRKPADLKRTRVADGIVGAEPVDRVEDAVHHGRVEATEVALRTRRELRPLDGVAHA